jgi:hypothetical protein
MKHRTRYRLQDFPDDLRAHVRSARASGVMRADVVRQVVERWPQFDKFWVHHVDAIVILGDQPPPEGTGGRPRVARPGLPPTVNHGGRSPVPISLGGPDWSRPRRFQT